MHASNTQQDISLQPIQIHSFALTCAAVHQIHANREQRLPHRRYTRPAYVKLHATRPCQSASVSQSEYGLDGYCCRLPKLVMSSSHDVMRSVQRSRLRMHTPTRAARHCLGTVRGAFGSHLTQPAKAAGTAARPTTHHET